MRHESVVSDAGPTVCVLVGRRGRDGWHCALSRPNAAVVEHAPSPTTTLGQLLGWRQEPSAPTSARR